MKIAIKIILIAFFSFLAEQVFVWWSLVICAALVSALIPTTGKQAFFAGFVAIGLLWLLCGFLFSIQTDFVLTERVANIFGVNSPALILFSTLIGAITGGMGALCGNQLRQVVHYKKAYRSRHNY